MIRNIWHNKALGGARRSRAEVQNPPPLFRIISRVRSGARDRAEGRSMGRSLIT